MLLLPESHLDRPIYFHWYDLFKSRQIIDDGWVPPFGEPVEFVCVPVARIALVCRQLGFILRPVFFHHFRSRTPKRNIKCDEKPHDAALVSLREHKGDYRKQEAQQELARRGNVRGGGSGTSHRVDTRGNIICRTFLSYLIKTRSR